MLDLDWTTKNASENKLRKFRMQGIIWLKELILIPVEIQLILLNNILNPCIEIPTNYQAKFKMVHNLVFWKLAIDARFKLNNEKTRQKINSENFGCKE